MSRTPARWEYSQGVVREIGDERWRQVVDEGWSFNHDDKYTDNELPRAAASYCIGNIVYWPWDLEWWKPTDRRRDLIKAAALIVAEIERLDRIHPDTLTDEAKLRRSQALDELGALDGDLL